MLNSTTGKIPSSTATKMRGFAGKVKSKSPLLRTPFLKSPYLPLDYGEDKGFETPVRLLIL